MTDDSPRPPRRHRHRPIYAAAAVLLAAGAAIAVPRLADAATTLQSLAAAKGKTVGFALTSSYLSEPAYKNIADTEFNLVVAENAMKWDATEPSRNSFDYTAGDAVASYAASGGKQLYGHALVWHQQYPAWVDGITGGADLLAAMRNHISNVAGHYAGQVVAWDVVNEAFEDNGARRQSIFQQRIGDSYIEEAFKAARAADPAAKLCINDYSTDGINPKSTAIYNLVRDFKARGVPIDCVGFQAHLILGQVPSDLQANLQRFADLGVDVRITELDVRMTTPADASELATQRSDYQKVFTACANVTRCTGVTVWGITDRYSWVPDVFQGYGAALMWDENYARKPAYDGAAAGLGGTVTTPTPGPTTPGPAGGCAVTYAVNQWNAGFTANVTVRNTGSSPISGWSLRWDYAAGQTVTQSWSSSVTQSGATVTATNAAWNGSIPVGGSTSFGFNGTHTGSNPAPVAFALNGAACVNG
ncbi:endo-1,4-beta-xylanase [Catenuloplanes atrovinosus]|uniref:Beta-xylanase n=1 Tax=Catenuloplanes atrovinosus TaxID=137266 RepID=A0AAE3YVU9_9ACTN|nr:endo-1,4-beta-xylanase [Catenuloplanes atrovinosus]MDR7280640.1 endo-1,4-beta-xylanase [Catenuloplanes atrovinosus]